MCGIFIKKLSTGPRPADNFFMKCVFENVAGVFLSCRWLVRGALFCSNLLGADYRVFSQFGYIFYVLSMPIESTKELCAYGRFLNGKRS